jgi:hypothetical protein
MVQDAPEILRLQSLPPGYVDEEFSIENLEHAIALHFMYYNFARPHKTLANPYPRTPAMAVGISNHIWTIEEILQLIY